MSAAHKGTPTHVPYDLLMLGHCQTSRVRVVDLYVPALRAVHDVRVALYLCVTGAGSRPLTVEQSGGVAVPAELSTFLDRYRSSTRGFVAQRDLTAHEAIAVIGETFLKLHGTSVRLVALRFSLETSAFGGYPSLLRDPTIGDWAIHTYMASIMGGDEKGPTSVQN